MAREPGIGLTDKLYWRYVPESPLVGVRKDGGLVHCFCPVNTKTGRKYVSLCGRFEIEGRIGGQEIRRPSVGERCARCDSLEIERRDWKESGPATV